MKILFEDIPPHGVTIQANLAKPWAADAAREAMPSVPSALTLDFLVQRTGRYTAQVTGSLSATSHATCCRCLSDVSMTLSGNVSLLYSASENTAEHTPELDISQLNPVQLNPAQLDPAQMDRIVGTDDNVPTHENALEDARLDVGWFDGVTLDMGHVVSEQLALWEPLRIVCDDAAVSRVDGGSCESIQYDRGPEVKRDNPFAQLAGLKLPK